MRPNGGNRRRRPRQPKIDVPLMTDYGFGISDEGRIIHFQADGAEDGVPDHIEKEMETFPATLEGPVIAGGCNGDHTNVVIDNTEKGVKGHTGLKCLSCHIGWIMPKKQAKEYIAAMTKQ